MAHYTEEQLTSLGLDPQRIPRHTAVIMDGNGRWAKQRGLPRAAGHRAGVNRLREIIRFSSDAGMEALTIYAFSTENWKRPADEISVLCGLLVEYFSREIDELDANAVRIKAIGDISLFPDAVQKAVTNAMERTKHNDGLKLNIALNYGAQAELLQAARALAKQAMETGELPDRAAFEAELYTADSPSVDYLIRTSGEKRLSNFLLYQLAYAELYFTPVFWPDFTQAEYIKALKEFGRHDRRYGGLSAC